LARFLAIDWDQNLLYVVSGTVRGNVVKVERAAAWQEERSPNPADAEALGHTLRERLKSAGIAPAPLLACVGRDRVILKDVRYPAVPEAEEPAVVRFQASKELTDSPDDVVIDFTPVERPANGEYRSLALVLRRELLDTWQKLAGAAGLKLAGLTPRPFGVGACLNKVMGTTVLTPAPEPADGAVAVVTLSEKWAEFSVFRGPTLLMARSLAAGPHLAQEVRRNLIVYAGQAPAQPVRALYLAGTGSGELREKLADLTDLPVHTFDPFAGAESPHLPAGNRGAFAGAAGLLQARAAGLPINFAAVRQVKPPKNPQNRLVAYAVAAAVLLAAAVVGGAKVVEAKDEREIAALQGDTMMLEEELAQLRDDTRRLKAMDEWDSLPWADELYELAGLIKDVNALRVTHFNAEPLPRTPGSRAVAKVTIRGTVQDQRGGRQPVDQLVAELRREGFYTVPAPKMTGNQFLLEVTVERRPPSEYKVKLPPAPKAAAPPAEEDDEDDMGDMGGAGQPNRGGMPGRGGVPGRGGPGRGGFPNRGGAGQFPTRGTPGQFPARGMPGQGGRGRSE
jgi:Tfp pilus assembly PilM family ATPase